MAGLGRVVTWLVRGEEAGLGLVNFTKVPEPFCFPRFPGQATFLRGVGPLVSHTLSPPPPPPLGAVMCGVAMTTKWGQGT